LEVFRRRGIRVIAGLVHHGSGPIGTDLLDPEFPSLLARHAGEVARRFPWITAYTPVNEPLTTARFSGLYGVWYPHAHNDSAFVRALITQIVAIQGAMHAIHEVTPDAMLVATEDLGFTHANPVLRYQAAFENERRWLTFDLLHGRVTRHHLLWKFLCRSAPVRRALAGIADTATNAAARPGLLGINHYLTSERFLDEEVHHYPTCAHGGNRQHTYADVEAVRVLLNGVLGPQTLIEQAAERYGVPIAITEAHLACTREQQMLWLRDLWQAANGARANGYDVRAVTAWALLGSFDWRSLLTQEELAYESGAFDVRAPTPRATALVPMIQALARGDDFEHPALHAEAWWSRSDRLQFPPRRGLVARHASSAGPARAGPAEAAPVLITGANGTLGHALRRLVRERGLRAVSLSRRDCDIANPMVVRQWLDRVRPWAVINAAGWVRVDDAEQERNACMRVNALGSEVLAQATAQRGIALLTFSSDFVFGEHASRPFVESDHTDPQNCYGESKVESERRVLHAHPSALIARTSAFFGDWDDGNVVSRALASLLQIRDVFVPDDAIVSPTYITDLGHTALDLLIDGAHGIWHLANVGACSWFELTRLAASQAGMDPYRIQACSSAEFGWHAPRPSYSVLGSERATLLDSLDGALARYTLARPWERIARQAAISQRPDITVSMRAHTHARSF
jgi:dTDP-4-dehydrorhamnose reductase